MAIETALGGALQNIVVDTENDAKAAIGYLKQRDGGRATFLPLDAIRGDELRESRIEGEYGFVGVACGLVQLRKRYDGVFRNLLGRTVVVEDLDSGVAMARKYRNRFRIVTLDGQVINRGGSMTGGSVSRSAGVLSRANELERLAGAGRRCAAGWRRPTAAGRRRARELQKAQYELEVAKEQQRGGSQRGADTGGPAGAPRDPAGEPAPVLDGLQQELARLSTAGRQEQAHAMQAMQQADRRPRGRGGAPVPQRRRAGPGRPTYRPSRPISGQITEHKTALAALAAERDGLLHSRRGAGAICRPRWYLTGRSGRRWRSGSAGPTRSAAGDGHPPARRTEELDGPRAAELRSSWHRWRRRSWSWSAARPGRTTRCRAATTAVLHTEREVPGWSSSKTPPPWRRAEYLDKLWESYELSHTDAQSQRMELESIPKATRRIAELNREIKSPGHAQHRRHRGVRPGEHPLYLPLRAAERRGEGQGGADWGH